MRHYARVFRAESRRGAMGGDKESRDESKAFVLVARIAGSKKGEELNGARR